MTNVPTATLASIGKGTVATPPAALSGQPALTSGGLPEIVYIGAEYCPYCAAERWPMAVALSRFGTFSNLNVTHSDTADVYPNTKTLTFYKSSYTSKYIVFTPVEQTDPNKKPLQQTTAQQNALLSKYDSPPYVSQQNQGAIPFVDFANKYLISGASYSPQVLQGKSWAQISAALSNPASPIAKAVDGTANEITAAICKMTGNTACECLYHTVHHRAERKACNVQDQAPQQGPAARDSRDSKGQARGGRPAGATARSGCVSRPRTPRRARRGRPNGNGQQAAARDAVNGARPGAGRNAPRVAGGPPAWVQLTTFILSLAGLGVSIYLTITHYSTGVTLACPDTGAINCEKVITSPQSIVFGIPVAVLGLAFFVFMVAVNNPLAWRSPLRVIHLARILSVIVGIVFVIYLDLCRILQGERDLPVVHKRARDHVRALRAHPAQCRHLGPGRTLAVTGSR